MLIDLNHPIVRSMMARPTKFTSDTEMSEVLGGLYGGSLSSGLDAATSLAANFVRGYSGTFAYILNIKRDVDAVGVPPSKLKGVLNVLRAEAIAQRDGKTFSPSRFTPRRTGTPPPPATDTGLDISDLAAGDYVVPDHNIIIHVEKPGPASKWHGWVFLSGGVSPDEFAKTPKLSRDRLASQRPGGTCKINVTDHRVAILSGWLPKMVVATPAAAVPPPPPPTAKPKPAPAATPAPVKADPPPPPTVPGESIRDRVKKQYGL